MPNGLLPSGFYDTLVPEAKGRFDLVQTILKYLARFGYDHVEPPLVEFEHTLLSGSGQELADQVFRVLDPISHKMMGIRADMTPQIARIATDRLAKAPKPLRLAYAGPVLRTKGDGAHGHRECWQAGFECIGSDDVRADEEVIRIAIRTLHHLGVKELCIDFTLPSLVRSLLSDLDLDETKQALVCNALDKKDQAALSLLISTDECRRFEPLFDLNVSLEQLKVMEWSSDIREDLDHLEGLMTQIKEVDDSIALSIDPLESLKFLYHTGVGFSMFAKGARAEMARGGRYCISQADSPDEGAVGVSFYIHELLKEYDVGPVPQRKMVPYTVTDEDIDALQAQGYVTVYSDS